MGNNFNLNFFNEAMKSLSTNTSAETFATNYANASKAEKGSSVWQKAYEEGLKQFSTIDINKGSEGIIDEEEMKIVGLYVERINGKDHKLPQTIEDFTGDTSFNNIHSKYGVIAPKSNPNIQEQQHLKPVGSMTKEEMETELAKYKEMGLTDTQELPKDGNVPKDKSINKSKAELMASLNINPQKTKKTADNELTTLRKELSNARRLANETDYNSDHVDFHIGTFNQGELGDCTMLSQINGMSDEQIRKMIQTKTDENGNKYYEVTFPIDSNSGTSVRITEAELNSRTLTIEKDGQTKNIGQFSTGDADVTLIEMAYIRRFGINPAVDGADIKFVNDIFTYPEENRTHVGTSYNITEEKLISAMQNGEHATLALTHASRLPSNFSYNKTFQSASGLTAQWGILDDPGENRNAVINRLKEMFAKYGNENTNIAEYENMTEPELMDAINRYVSQDFYFEGELRLSNGIKIMEDHAYTLKNYNPETRELTIANPHNSNEDITIPLDIAQNYLEISI